MADVYLASPRRVSTMIRLHAGEVASIICQKSMLEELTEEEIQKIMRALNIEINDRENKYGN